MGHRTPRPRSARGVLARLRPHRAARHVEATTHWLWLIAAGTFFIAGLLISEVWFGSATEEELQPNIDGLSRDEALLAFIGEHCRWITWAFGRRHMRHRPGHATSRRILVRSRSERNRGPFFTAAGVAILVAALLFGLTKTSNGETVADWVSIITAIGGLIVRGRRPVHDVARATSWNGTDRPHAARTVMTGDSRALREARASVPRCRPRTAGSGGRPAARHWAGWRRFAPREDVHRNPRRPLHHQRRAPWTSARAHAPAFRNRSDRDVGSAPGSRRRSGSSSR